MYMHNPKDNEMKGFIPMTIALVALWPVFGAPFLMKAVQAVSL